MFADVKNPGHPSPCETATQFLGTVCRRASSPTLKPQMPCAIRADFEAWVESQGVSDTWTRWRMCMVIDKECLQTLKGITAETLEDDLRANPLRDGKIRYVKGLEAFPEIDQYNTFPGWMKSWTSALWDLWSNMEDGAPMSLQFELIDEDDDGIYCG